MNKETKEQLISRMKEIINYLLNRSITEFVVNINEFEEKNNLKVHVLGKIFNDKDLFKDKDISKLSNDTNISKKVAGLTQLNTLIDDGQNISIFEYNGKDIFDTYHGLRSTQKYTITFTCKKCGTVNNITNCSYYMYKDKVLGDPEFCCYMDRYKRFVEVNNIERQQESVARRQHIIDTAFPNNDTEIISYYYGKCRSRGHIFRCSDIKYKKDPHCPICKMINDKSVELLNIMEELNTNYILKEEFERCKMPGLSVVKKKLRNFTIYTFNDKRYLTGKIVFDDPFADKQATSKYNKLVFRWFNINKINDRQYCLNFLNDFFDEIVRKNKIREKMKNKNK